jgi:hypothetical protein
VTGGGAFSFDPWNVYSRTSHTATSSGPRLLSNGKVIVIGAPGNGKSALVKTLCFRLACFGRVEAIDPKGEYGPLIRALGGVAVRLEPGGSGALNPLTDVGDPTARRTCCSRSRRRWWADSSTPARRSGGRRVYARHVSEPDTARTFAFVATAIGIVTGIGLGIGWIASQSLSATLSTALPVAGGLYIIVYPIVVIILLRRTVRAHRWRELAGFTVCAALAVVIVVSDGIIAAGASHHRQPRLHPDLRPAVEHDHR